MPSDALRRGPILPTLARLAAPNVVAMTAVALVSIAETAYIGRLGAHALAGVALVFPIIMLMQMISAGAMGGGISSAISRALGAGDAPRAQSLALCALIIGLAAGAIFAALIFVFGPLLYRALGAEAATLSQAVAYSHIAALAVFAIWLSNSTASALRGSGRMAAPAGAILTAGALQIAAGGVLGFGLFGLPRLGVAGIAAGQVVAFSIASLMMIAFLRAPQGPVRLAFKGVAIARSHFADILRVGLPATLSPLQSILSVLIVTGLVARFGAEALAGYGIGARLEFLVIPIAFSVGAACVPMVGVAIGAGDVARARRVAWTAGALAFAVLAALALIVIAAPDAWAGLVTSDAPVLDAARAYLRLAAFGYPFFALGLCLYFGAQGAGRIGGPLAAQTLRLAIIAGGGWAIAHADAPLWTLFALTGAAMIALGLGTATAVRLTPWDRR